MAAGVQCETCDDDGYIDLIDEETGGVIGPAPCPRGCDLPPGLAVREEGDEHADD